MNFIKLGNNFINLDQVHNATWDNSKHELTLSYSPTSGQNNTALPDITIIKGQQAMTLYRYLAEHSMELPEIEHI